MKDKGGEKSSQTEIDEPCGRGKKMTKLPVRSVYTLATEKQMMDTARWAVYEVGLPPYLIDEGIQEILFAFARHRIGPEVKVGDLGKLMRTTAKRWAIDVKRKLGYAVKLNPNEFFSEEDRSKAKTVDSELDPSISLFHQGDDEDDLDWDFEVNPDDSINYANLAPEKVMAIDRAWYEMKPAEQGIFRHVLAGHSFARAGELERVSAGTAKSHQAAIMQKIADALR